MTGYNKNCITNDYKLNGIALTEDTIWDSALGANNMAVNGNQAFASNYNFTGMTYNAGGYFNKTGTAYVFLSDTYIKINPKHRYKCSFEIRNGEGSADNPGKYYLGISPYDKDKIFIPIQNIYNRVGATLSTLSAPLAAGETTAYVTDTTGWNATNGYIAFYDAQTEYTNFRYTKKINAISAVAAGQVTLTSAYSGTTIPSGTACANNVTSESYQYIAASNVVATDSWVVKTSASIGGWTVGTANDIYFRHGTEYIKMLMLLNREGTPSLTCSTDVKNIKLWDLTTGEATDIQSYTTGVSATQFHTYELLEIPFHNTNIMVNCPLDDDIIDYAGSHATVVGGTSFVAGYRTNCLSFNGTSDDFKITGSDLTLGRIAISFMIKLDATIDWNTRFDILTGTQGSPSTAGRIVFYRSSTTELTLSATYDTGTSTCTITGADTIFTGNWVHVIIVLRGKDYGSAGIKIYINGALNTSATVANVINYANTDLWFMSNCGASNFTKGLLENVKVFDVEPTAAQCATIYEMDMLSKVKFNKTQIFAPEVQEYIA